MVLVPVQSSWLGELLERVTRSSYERTDIPSAVSLSAALEAANA